MTLVCFGRPAETANQTREALARQLDSLHKDTAAPPRTDI